MTTIDLNNLNKSVKTTVKLQQGSVESLKFLNDIEGQVQFYESGSDIIVKAYGTKELYGGVKIVDTRKTLVTYTYKNGAKVGDMGSLTLTTDWFSANLLSEIYDPVKKRNKYTGTFLSEEVNSTSANETFALGTGEDRINFDFSTKQGKDTINISKGQTLYLDVQNGDDLDYKYTRSGNDLTIKGTRYYDNPYNIKAIVSIASKKNGFIYNVGIKAYDYNEETHTYSKNADAVIKQSSGALVTTSYMLEAYGLKAGKTYTIYASSPYSVGDIETKIFLGQIQLLSDCIYDFTRTAPITQELISQITLKDYFKNGTPDCVTGNLIDQTALVEVLNESYDRSGAKKAQTIKDTFFDEELYGGTNGDKITSSGGNDRIEGGKGNDTITLGSGNKDIY
ncbi:hypothetical protein IKQ21_02410, partial [bacterium]|nr:hypothetical protein [bacterium]